MRFFVLGITVLVACAFAEEAQETAKEAENVVETSNPCQDHHCSHGYECDVDEDGNPSCVCLKSCPKPEPDEQVCSTQNETFTSECELDRQRCLCHHEKVNCTDTRHKHAHLDYYGYCREFPACDEWQMESFPVRMRNWLKNVLVDLAKRKDIPPKEIELAEKSKSEQKAWVVPVLWKFCDLDRHPYDGKVTRRELLAITAQLKTMEHCVAPFLDQCAGDDKTITVDEWTSCLGMTKDEISNFNEICDEIHKAED